MSSEPRLPVSLVMWLLGIMLSGFGVYMALDSRVRDGLDASRAVAERIGRIELLLCAGADEARRSECQRQGIKI